MSETLSSTQAREWARTRPEPVTDLIGILARLRQFERADRLYYGEDEHRYAIETGGELFVATDADWARRNDDPVSELGEFRWVLNQFERAARQAYGSPTHCNALEYANSRRHALFEMAGLKPLEGDF